MSIENYQGANISGTEKVGGRIRKLKRGACEETYF